MHFTFSETRLIVLPDTENRMIVSSFTYTKHRNVTDRRTDMLSLLQRSALQAMWIVDALFTVFLLSPSATVTSINIHLFCDVFLTEHIN